MTIFSDVSVIRGGATPHTFDGSGSITLNTEAKRIVALCTGNSLSARAQDEGTTPMFRLDSPNWAGTIDVQAGWIMGAETAANAAPSPSDVAIVPFDIPVKGDTVVNINVSEVAGATQTGTHDCAVGLLYSDLKGGADIIQKIPNIVGIRGGGYGYKAANAATTEAALSTFTIPGYAREIVGGKFIQTLDTAATADEETTGYVRLDLGLANQGVQKYPLNGGCPQDGTDVDTGNHPNVSFIPMHIPLTSVNSAITVKAYVNAASAITGGAGIVCNLVWR